MSPPNPASLILDRENAFLLYATFCGDVIRTAAALNVPARSVLAVADEEGWAAKLAPIIELSRSTRPGDVERAINRALNFVQAHKLRMLLNRTLRMLTDMSEAQLNEVMVTIEASKLKDHPELVTKRLTTRGLADLATAFEKTHAMTYNALSDLASQRIKRDDIGGPEGVVDLHAAIAKSMAEAGRSTSPRAQLFDAQVEIGQTTVEQTRTELAETPVRPEDNDEH